MPGWKSTLLCCERIRLNFSLCCNSADTEKRFGASDANPAGCSASPAATEVAGLAGGRQRWSWFPSDRVSKHWSSLPGESCSLGSQGALGHVSPCLCTQHSMRAHKRAVLSAEPPPPCTNTALFSQRGSSFLFHFGRVNSFSFSSVVLVEDCVPFISCI